MADYEKDGRTLDPLFETWRFMIRRCHEPTNRAYHRYGARGIKVCDKWRDPKRGFWYFKADMGPRPPGGTLERRDNDGNYTPKNCLWANRMKQTHNRNCSYPKVEWCGESRHLVDWLPDVPNGLSWETLAARIFIYGWTVQDAFTLPNAKQTTLSYKGRTQTLKAWAEELGLNYKTVSRRFKEGRPAKDVLTMGRIT